MAVLMIIDNSDLLGAFVPTKDDAPLVVHSDRMKPSEGSFQRFESVPRRRAQIHQCTGGVQILELSLRDSSKFTGKTAGYRAVPVEEQIFGELTRERCYHNTIT